MSDPNAMVSVPEWVGILAARLTGVDAPMGSKVLVVGTCLSSPGHQVVVVVDRTSSYSLETALASLTCPLCGWYGLRVAR